MTEIEDIEFELATKCSECRGDKTYLTFACCSCLGSGLARDYIDQNREVSLYRRLHPRSRATRVYTHSRDQGGVSTLTCIFCRCVIGVSNLASTLLFKHMQRQGHMCIDRLRIREMLNNDS